ncbi:MAG: hypothetical protein V4549_07575 [Bacteroidota bacterium]
MSELLITKEQAALQALQKQATDIAVACSKINITDDTTLSIAQQKYSEANKLVKDIDAKRTEVKKPYWDACTAIDALAKKLSDPIKKAVDDGKIKMLTYDKQKKEKALQEQNRILGIKNAIAKYSNDAIAEMDKCTTMEQLREVRERLIVNHPGKEKWFEFLPDFMNTRLTLNEYSKSRKTAITTPAQVDEEETAIIKEHIEETNNQIGTAAIAETVVTKLAGSRKTWKFSIESLDDCPFEWIMLNEAVVKKYMSDNKESLTDGCIINGVKFFLEESLTIR